MSNNSNKLLKNTSYLILVQVANLLLPFISLPIITRILGVENFGKINYSIALINYFILIIDFSFNYSAVRSTVSVVDDRVKVNAIFNRVFTTKIILFVISTLIFLLGLFLFADSKSYAISILAYLFTISTVLNNNWFYQAFQVLSKVALFSFFNKLLFTVLIIVVIKEKDDYLYYVMIYSLTAIVTSILSFLYILKKYQLKLQLVSLLKVLEILKKDYTLFLSMVIISLYTTTNIVLLGIRSNAHEVGIFSSSEKIIILVNTILNISFSQALYPYISLCFNKNKEHGITTIKKIIPIVLLVVGSASVIVGLMSKYIVLILFGSEFLAASPLITLLSIIPIIICLSNILGIQVMLNLKMDKQFLFITIIGAITGLTSNYFLSNYFGALGTSISWILAECMITSLMIYYLYKNKISLFSLNYFKPNNLKSLFSILLKGNKNN